MCVYFFFLVAGCAETWRRRARNEHGVAADPARADGAVLTSSFPPPPPPRASSSPTCATRVSALVRRETTAAVVVSCRPDRTGAKTRAARPAPRSGVPRQCDRLGDRFFFSPPFAFALIFFFVYFDFFFSLRRGAHKTRPPSPSTVLIGDRVDRRPRRRSYTLTTRQSAS